MNTNDLILQFEESGYLRSGIHNCTIESLRRLTFTNSHRERLGFRLMEFLKWPIQAKSFSHVYIGGGFVSDRPFPVDVDLVLEPKYPFGPEGFSAIEPFFSQGLDKILSAYSVDLHFWMENGPPTLLDYRAFFQYQRPKRTDAFNLERRGILRLSIGPTNETDTDESLDLFAWSQSKANGQALPATSRPRPNDALVKV